MIGHVDHGKSTLIGRLLLETNSLPKGKIAEIKRISKKLSKDTELAYLADQLKEEREKNISIDTTQLFFKTQKRNYCIIDAPGHVKFIRNMITGATLAEAAILVVDVREGIAEQTCRHAYLINMLGLNKIIVVLNKMDLVGYKLGRFNEVKKELLKFLENLKMKPSFIIPASAKEGVNVSKKTRRINCYKGPFLLKALDSFKVSTKTTKKPLRFPIQDVYKIENEKIIIGRITSGVIKQGQRVVLLPQFKNVTIKAIKVFGERKTAARQGESIGLTLKEPLSIKRGEVIVAQKNLPQPTDYFKGNIFWMSNEPLQLNKLLTFRCSTQETKCVVKKIEKRIDSSTLKIIEENADMLKLNETGVVSFKTEKPIVVERFSFINEIGKFVIEKECNLQGAGIITEGTIR